MKQITETIIVDLLDLCKEVQVHYYYSYDAGQWTLSNGDPGYPPSEDIEIVKVVDTETNKEVDDVSLSNRDLSQIEQDIHDKHFNV